MKRSRPEEDKNTEGNIIKDVKNISKMKQKIYGTMFEDVRNLFKLKKERSDTTIQDLKFFFRLKKENEEIKDRIVRDVRNLFEHKEEQNYLKSVKLINFWRNNQIEYEKNCDRKRKLSVKRIS